MSRSSDPNVKPPPPLISRAANQRLASFCLETGFSGLEKAQKGEPLTAALVSLSGLTYPAVANGVVTFAFSLFLMGNRPPVLKLALVSNKSHIRPVFCRLIHAALLSPPPFWPQASLGVQRLPPVIDCCPVARAAAQGGARGACPGLADPRCK